MANFGITRLSVVSSEGLDREAARPLAIGAESVLESAEVVPSLQEAIAGSALVAGITRRVGKKRKEISYTPWDFAEKALSLRGSSVSLVFGNERAGLSDEELLLCHLAVAIPTSPMCPSLNLSHAVEIIGYELFRAERIPNQGAAADVETLEKTSSEIVGSLERLGYHWHGGPRGIRTFLRDLLARATPTVAETRRFAELFAKLAGMHGSPRAEAAREKPRR